MVCQLNVIIAKPFVVASLKVGHVLWEGECGKD